MRSRTRRAWPGLRSTLLHYLTGPMPREMYVSEVFNVVSGRIVRIDNIGIMMQGVATLGFTH